MKKFLATSLAASMSVLAATSPIMAFEDAGAGSGSSTVVGTAPSTYTVVIPATIYAGYGNTTFVELRDANISPDAIVNVYVTNLLETGELALSRADGETGYARVYNDEEHTEINSQTPLVSFSYDDCLMNTLSKGFFVAIERAAAGDYTGVMNYSFSMTNK